MSSNFNCGCIAMSSLAYIPFFREEFFVQPIYTDYAKYAYFRAELSDTILKGTLPRTIPPRFGVICFSGFREEDLNVIFYQNMPNLHNLYHNNE
jgi:hypothetical protein